MNKNTLYVGWCVNVGFVVTIGCVKLYLCALERKNAYYNRIHTKINFFLVKNAIFFIFSILKLLFFIISRLKLLLRISSYNINKKSFVIKEFEDLASLLLILLVKIDFKLKKSIFCIFFEL